MRDISPTVSASWVGVGFSQGGQAVWAANELNAYYGKDLQLQGSVALAPAANVTGIADLVSSGSLTAEQRSFFPLLVVGVARYSRDLDEGSFLHGSAELYRAQLSRCEPTASRFQSFEERPVGTEPLAGSRQSPQGRQRREASYSTRRRHVAGRVAAVGSSPAATGQADARRSRRARCHRPAGLGAIRGFRQLRTWRTNRVSADTGRRPRRAHMETRSRGGALDRRSFRWNHRTVELPCGTELMRMAGWATS